MTLRSYPDTAVTHGLYLVIGGFVAAGVVGIVLGLLVRNSAAAQIRRQLPDSPLQVLDKRLASGEISDEQYQYERFLLQNPK